MLDRLQKFFGDSMAPADQADDAQRLRVATCALLLEAAHADDEFTAEERETITALVRRRFDLDAAEADTLLEMANSEREAAGDMHQFTRLIGETFSRSRKLAVLELLWQVAYSDGVLEAHEDALVHRLGRMLDLRHDELIALKLRVKNPPA
ncbi:MAG: TerB family tellurite resistance protein [bacterium]|nr:TerB family tellurite resistance protein [bacterium]